MSSPRTMLNVASSAASMPLSREMAVASPSITLLQKLVSSRYMLRTWPGYDSRTLHVSIPQDHHLPSRLRMASGPRLRILQEHFPMYRLHWGIPPTAHACPPTP